MNTVPNATAPTNATTTTNPTVVVNNVINQITNIYNTIVINIQQVVQQTTYYINNQYISTVYITNILNQCNQGFNNTLSQNVPSTLAGGTVTVQTQTVIAEAVKTQIIQPLQALPQELQLIIVTQYFNLVNQVWSGAASQGNCVESLIQLQIVNALSEWKNDCALMSNRPDCYATPLGNENGTISLTAVCNLPSPLQNETLAVQCNSSTPSNVTCANTTLTSPGLLASFSKVLAGAVNKTAAPVAQQAVGITNALLQYGSNTSAADRGFTQSMRDALLGRPVLNEIASNANITTQQKVGMLTRLLIGWNTLGQTLSNTTQDPFLVPALFDAAARGTPVVSKLANVSSTR